jgi:hypothetical protein
MSEPDCEPFGRIFPTYRERKLRLVLALFKDDVSAEVRQV